MCLWLDTAKLLYLGDFFSAIQQDEFVRGANWLSLDITIVLNYITMSVGLWHDARVVHRTRVEDFKRIYDGARRVMGFSCVSSIGLRFELYCFYGFRGICRNLQSSCDDSVGS